MTKKIFAMFLAVLMVVSMLPTSVFAANCPAVHTIDNCEYTQVSVVAPTCGAPGYTYYECNDCHTKFIGSPVAATGEHTFEPTDGEPATCGEAGYTAGLKCKDCPKTKDCEIIPPKYKEGTPCNYGAWTPATFDCTADIVLTRTCKACGHVDEHEHEGVSAHTWGEPKVKVAATATSNGVAVQKCTAEVNGVKCTGEREIVVYFEHNCSFVDVAAVAPTCTENGMGAYSYCRICNVKYNAAHTEKLTDAKFEKLVIPAAHNFTTEPSCTDPNGVCADCKQTVFNIPHDMDEDNAEITGFNGTDKVTCTYGGFKTIECKNCNYFTTEAVDALGHETVTVTVPATCSAYGYTFTYCTRNGCDSIFAAPNKEYEVEVFDEADRDDLDAKVKPHKDGAFYLAYNTNAFGESDLFFTGSIVDGKMETTYDVTKAAKVYVSMEHILASGNYYMYILDANAEKNYIEFYETEDGEISVRLTKELPETTYGFITKTVITSVNGSISMTHSDGTMKCDFDGEQYVLTLDKGSFVVTKFTNDVVRINLSNIGTMGAPIKVTACTVGTEYDVSNHKWSETPMVDELLTYDPTCTKDGLMTFQCSSPNCIETKAVVVPAGHKWEDVADRTADIPIGNNVTEKAYKAAGCEDGWHYQYCTACKAATPSKDVYNKVVDKGYGHKYGELQVFNPTHTATKGYDKYICQYCNGDLKVGEEKIWAHANTLWESLAAAMTEHDLDPNAAFRYIVNPTCTTTGIIEMVCSDANCRRNVKIVVPDLHDPSNATEKELPNCTTDGWYKTFECADRDCKVIIGNGAIGDKNVIPKLGHMMKANKDYKPADCDAPDWDLVVEECTRCDYEVKAFKKVNISTDDNAVADCEDATITLYYCYECDGYHAKNFSAKLSHVMVELDKKGTHDTTKCGVVGCDGKNAVASTCYSAGYKTSECTVCGKIVHVAVATIEHVNAAGEKFTNRCDDTTADRHCVVCCRNADTEHGAKCDKSNCAKVKDENGKYLCKCMIPNSHEGTAVNVGSSCLENAYTLTVCKFCSKPTVELSKNPWNGHKPVAAAKDANNNPIKYGNYKYVDFEWKSTGVANGAFVDASETIHNAEFIEYVPATYAADGYWKGECAICEQVVTQVLPKLTGLGFEMIVSNANGAKDYSYGSLVEVILSVTGSKTDLHGFTANLPIDTELKYVGYEVLNKDFNITVTEPAKVDKTAPSVSVVGAANNTLAGKQQNINIDGDVQLVKLLFRVVESAKGEANFGLVVPNAVYLKDGETKNISGARIDSEKIKVRGFLDFDHSSENVGSTETEGNINDLFLAMSLLTGEHPDGKTYDVTVDINKDGVITLEDLAIAYNYEVGNYSDEEIAKMGLSDAEIAILYPSVNECLRPTCDAEVPVDALYCPVCGFNQK